jgi:outer membrane protein W
MKRIRMAAHGIVAALIIAVPAGAQLAGRVVFTPYTGVYSATNSIAVAGNTSLIQGSLKQQTGWVNGANLSYWFTDRLALEAGAAYTAATVKGSLTQNEPGQPLFHDFDEGSRVWMTSAKLMLQVLPQTNRLNLRIGAGPALINVGGKAFEADTYGEFSNLTSVGIASSACTRLALSDDVGLRIRVENYSYGAQPEYKNWRHSTVTKFDSKGQSDFVFSTGLQVFMK